MSASINGFNEKMAQEINKSINVFNDIEILELIKARCKDIGIDIRDNLITKFRDYCSFKCKNRIVDLSDCFLGINSIQLLSRILYTSDKIARLNLAKNNLGDYGIGILINAIKDSTSLISLNITSNSITYKGGKVIFQLLTNQQSIIDLNVSSIEGTYRNRLTAEGVKNIEFFLHNNIFIETFNISGNSIKNDGFCSICKGLNNNNTLLNLNISNNDIHSKGISQGLNLISICKLFYLNISNNPLLDEGLKHLSDSLTFFQNLHTLNVANCSFHFSGFEHLMKTLQFNKRIEYLNVSGNNLKKSNFEILKPCFSSFGIRNLNMSKCLLGNENACILGECIIGNESLKKINISENKISDLGFKTFIPLFSNNNNIEVFDCSINFISDVTAKEFIYNMKYNRTLKKINFYDNELKNEMGELFLKILETNRTLIYINLIFNKVQMKTIDEINHILKINCERQKARFVPNLQRDIRNLKFNPELFKSYAKNIINKKSQQKVLYERVKQDDRHLSKLKSRNNRKLDIKMQEKEILQTEITECQEKIKGIKDNIEKCKLQEQDIEMEINDKIEEEVKILKKIKEQNGMLRTEYNLMKKDLQSVIDETEQKLKKRKENLNLKTISLWSLTKELKKKEELYKKLYNPDMLVSIKDTKNEQNKFNKDKKKSFKIAKRTISKNNINSITSHIINNNINSENNQTGITTTNNDIIATSTSMNDYKIKDSVRNLIQKGTENKK
jgi:Ran GTPase-activating protein (RanGAP) involved in mRNA processing and transport